MKRIMTLALILLIAGCMFLPGAQAGDEEGGTVALEILYTSDMNGHILPCQA